MKKIKKYLWILLYSLSFIFIAYYLYKYAYSLKSIFDSPQHILYFILAIILNGLAFLVMALNWVYMIKRHHKDSVTLSLLKSFYISQLTRYIPGNIWSFIVRFKENSKYGISKSTTAYLLVIENVSLISTSFIFSLFAIGLVKVNSYLQYGIVIFAICSFFILFFNPKVFRFILNLFAKKFKTEITYNELNKIDLVIVFIFFSIYWFLFGAAFYLISYLFIGDKISFLTAIGINALAWLAGYLSFLTPSGLVVREGTIIFVLIKFTSNIISSNIAIISRFVFTISEVLGFLIIYTVDIVKKKSILKRFNLTSTKIFLIIFILFYVLYFSVLSVNKYVNLQTGRYDLGNMDQAVWNSEHGRLFQMENPDNDQIISRMTIHSDVILVLISPIYYIYESPITLLIFQTIIIALGAIPIYILAKKVIKNEYAALIFSISYLLYPALERVNSYEFHGVSLAITLFLFAFLYIYEKKYLPAFIFCILAITTKEEIGLIVFLLGLYILFINKNKKMGIIFSSIGLISSVLLIWIIIPHFRPNETAHFAVKFFDDFGNTPTSIIKGIITNPHQIIESIFNPDTYRYLHQLFAPLGFLSLFSIPTLLIASSEFGINLLSKSSAMHSIEFQYTSGIIPFMFISAIFGFQFIIKILSPIYNKYCKKYIKLDLIFILTIYVLTVSIIYNYKYGILPFSKENLLTAFTPNPSSAVVSKLEEAISAKYSVSVSESLASHFTERIYLYDFPIKINDVDYIVLLSNDLSHGLDAKSILKAIDLLKKSDIYNLKYENCNVIVFEKKGLLDPAKVDWKSLGNN